MAVLHGGPPGSSHLWSLSDLDDENPLQWAREWFDDLWPQARPVPMPQFAVNDDVVVTATGRDHQVLQLRI